MTAIDFGAPGKGVDDPRNFSVAARGLSADVARIVYAAARVVQAEIKNYQAAVLMAEPKVRKRACEVHGGIGNAWQYFADPDVMDLATALHNLDRETPK